jgi:formate hydrogenlyase subunit 3/multisubunit Na+/H+ antiporter MnhD subunit
MLVGIVILLFSGFFAIIESKNRAIFRLLHFILMGLGGAIIAAAGAIVLIYNIDTQWQLPLGLPWLHWHQRLDALSGFFSIIIGIVTVAISFYAPSYVKEYDKTAQPFAVLGLATAIFIVAMELVLLADDALTFMIAWELMSLSSYFLVTFQHQNSANRRAGFIYLLMAHIGGLFILLSFGILAGFSSDFTFTAMAAAHPSKIWMTLTFVCALIGFGMKAGLVPIHIWLPEAHPVAPSHISAMMSGVMLKVAVYGFIRVVFQLIGEIYWGWGAALLIIACMTALYGVLYAMVQEDMKKMLAYSSVENIGIIFIGLALSLIFFGNQLPKLGALALIAALLHSLNHAMFKSLLFMGAGAVLQASREHDIDRMGGILRRMPWTGILFLLGCISIAGLPPSNGFVSEWLIFQTSLQAQALESGVLRAMIPLSAAVLALTGALAATCFVKLYGIAFLGVARTRTTKRTREVSKGMITGQAILAACCVLIGFFPSSVVDALNQITKQTMGVGLDRVTSHGWMWLTPISSKTAEYSAPQVWLGLSLALAGWFFVYLLMKRRHRHKRTKVAAWDCGFGPLNSRMQYTGASFTMPIRRIFGVLWRHQEETSLEARNGLTEHAHTLRYKESIEDITWRIFYSPIIFIVTAATKRVGKIQTGHLRHYLGYSFFTLLVLLWLIS